MKTISVEISEEFDRELRIQAAQLDMNRSEFIRKTLEEKISPVGGKPAAGTKATQPLRAVDGTRDEVERDKCKIEDNVV